MTRPHYDWPDRLMLGVSYAVIILAGSYLLWLFCTVPVEPPA